ncbi:TetR family transcriptional regulator [Phyllobacterium lublinensis]|uniref:TetR family transcriptional regulator n=1 Tax=Phyllobacterium lublinensis TaxID=2875708 RepID=UPI001CCCDF34|nr:TetR family transcriptional regulator [Phyllobacterium sp. 2063]MBZ9655804.1 TetR family transcriptional regulator [Phyllobacterium sp. 2063]
MARPREFDRDAVLDKALRVFWAKGFAGTSTDDLREAMGIGRQSLYGAFGNKRALYLEALATYQQRTNAGHLKRLRDPVSPLKGIEDLLTGLVSNDDCERALGCMGVGSVGEFGITDEELNIQRGKVSTSLGRRIAERIEQGQRTKAAMIYKATGNLRAIQILLGHTKIENTVKYIGVDIEDALELAEHTEIRARAALPMVCASPRPHLFTCAAKFQIGCT